MGRRQRIFVLVMLALVASATITVPADLFAAKRSSPTAVAIPDVKSVAGRWAGTL